MIGQKGRLKISLEKVVAAGNDFIFVLAGRDVPLGWRPASQTVREICDRHFGVGADGLVVMTKLFEKKYEWAFFNNDGSNAAMCGNAARAAMCYLALEETQPVELATDFGLVRLETLGGHDFRIAIDYSSKKLELRRVHSVGSQNTDLMQPVLVDTGVPHVVLESSQDVLSLTDRALAAPFRWAEEAGPAGANVTFFKRRDVNSIDAITFERGVENYTLSCGTGVLAAALVASRALESHTWKDEIQVRNPGGNLRVHSSRFPEELLLAGPARRVFGTEIEVDEVK